MANRLKYMKLVVTDYHGCQYFDYVHAYTKVEAVRAVHLACEKYSIKIRSCVVVDSDHNHF
jgi:hypothetical protein